MNETSKKFGNAIQRVIQKQNLTREETKEMISLILMNQEAELNQGAFLSALAGKGETLEEISGCWDAISELDTAKVSLNTKSPVVENCGTGMDDLKTFNISTAAAIIAAANGVYMARHGARAITSKCGTVDLLEKIGINVECETSVVKKSIETCGIGIFNGMSAHVHSKLGRILAQIRFGSILNISASLANPALPKHAVRGVYSKDRVQLVAKIMREIGYKRAFVVCGTDDKTQKCMDEFSTLGKNFVCELKETGKLNSFDFYPEDIGISRGNYEEIAPLNTKEETKNFVGLISGNVKNSRHEIACLNAAPILMMMGIAKDLKHGIEIAKETIESGKALAKLNQWKQYQ